MMPHAQREITGRMVLFCLVGFFAVVAGINALMTVLAVSTFGGVETESSYKAGLAFSRELSASRAQDARRWRVQATMTPQSERQRIELVTQDADGRPLIGISAVARLSHPTDRRADIAVDLREASPGRYIGTATPSDGQWDLIVELARDGERLFRSKNRMVIKQR
jgi:nitrogen fixation protein FixH